jgi:parvulin-like peptidyl-prolyl isomerase
MPRAALSAVILLLLTFAHRTEGRTVNPEEAVHPSHTETVADNAILAEVNGEKIPVSRLRARMGKTDLRHARSFQGENEARKMALRELINERLVVQHMRAGGKTKSDEFRGRIGAIRTVSLGNRFLSEFQKEYEPGSDEVRAFLPPFFSDLNLRIFFGATFGEAAKTREAVLGGEDMERLVREKSVGPSAEDGGMILGYRSKTYIPEHIERGAFSSGKGWISPVFETPIGYAFVRVEDSRDLPAEEIARAAEGAVLLTKRAAGDRIIEESTLRAHISVDEAKVRELDTLPKSQWKERFGETVAEVGGEKVRVRDLYWFIFEGNRKVFPVPGSGEIPDLLNSLAKYHAVEKEAVARKIDRDPSFREWIREKSDKVLLDMFLGEVGRSVRVSGEEARKYFTKNRDAWKKPPGRKIREVQAPDRKMAISLLDQLREHPEQIDRFAADPGRGGKGGKGVVLYRRMMDPEDEKRVFGAPVGELAGPFQRGDVWSLIIVDREIPPVTNPVFEDHVEEAKSAARREKLKRVLREKIEELYRKANILTYNQVLNSVGW